MTSREKADRMIEIFKDVVYNTYVPKNDDYGNSFGELYNAFSDINGLLGVGALVIRLEDKLNRLKSLSENDFVGKVKDESFLDTLSDLMCYAAMSIVEIEERDKMNNVEQ